MGLHDASKSKALQDAFDKLGNNEAVESFLKTASSLNEEEMVLIVEQASLLLSKLYAHLPLKRNRHAVSPLLALEWLERRVRGGMPEETFHREMLEIFKGLRDAHTNYVLPDAYRKSIAFLPFLMEDYFTSNSPQAKRRFMVTGMLAGYSHPSFKKGARITHWNGTPIERAVLLNADREEGSNEAARFAFGLAAMTVRSLDSSLPPDEGQVMIRYIPPNGGPAQDILFPWRVWQPPHQPGGDNASALARALDEAQPEARISECGRAVSTHQARKHLFAAKAVRTEDQVRASDSYKRVEVAQCAINLGQAFALSEALDPAEADTDFSKVSTIPDALQFRPVGPSDAYGYIRIRHFGHKNTDQFVNEFIRILELLPKKGLIIDVRSNGGGIVPNGELILQTLTPQTVTPAPFEFINTDLTQKLCTVPEGLADGDWLKGFRQELRDTWGESLDVAAETAQQFSNGAPLTDPKAARAIGQRYHGPVVLITDAQCYSTTDIFAAGFQDHGIGQVIGVADNTGAGGANVWSHSPHLLTFLPEEDTGLEELPKGTSMRVSIRRTLRVGPNAGRPLEDLGVHPDLRYRMQEADILHGNTKLINFAVKQLRKKKTRRLEAELEAVNDSDISLSVDVSGIDTLEVRVDDRCRGSFAVNRGSNSLELDVELHEDSRIELRGYEGGELVAGRVLSTGDSEASGGTIVASFDSEASLEAITVRLENIPGKSFRRLADEVCPENWSYAVVHPSRKNAYDLFPPTELSPPEAWEVVHALRARDEVEYAEPLFEALRIADIVGEAPETLSPFEANLISTGTGPWVGSDKDYDWSLKMTQVREAWALPLPPGGKAQGEGIKVAHPDSGYSNHPEIDDERLLKSQSINFIEDYDGEPDAIDEDGFHGTGTASVIMSAEQKPSGLSGTATVIGVAPKAKLLPMRVAQQGFMRHAAILKRSGMLRLRSALYKAVDKKCHVISISLGWIFSEGIEAAIEHAWDNDIIICSAAGNYTGRVVAWPGASARTICLAGCTSRRRKWRFSTRGPKVDFTGPAKNVWRADWHEGKARVAPGSGTSHATATTAGIAALWLAHHGRQNLINRYRPHGVRLNEVFRAVLAASCDAPPKNHNRVFGLGTVNAKKALEATLPHPQQVPAPGGPFGPQGVLSGAGPDPTSLHGMLELMGLPRHEGEAELAGRLGLGPGRLGETLDGAADEVACAMWMESARGAASKFSLSSAASAGGPTAEALALSPSLRSRWGAG